SLGIPVVSPDFKEERGDKFQMISFFAKKARGLMAKYAIENRVTKAEELKGFDSEGYHFNESLSDLSKNKWVFTRKYESNQN
ncbi:MAG: peroxide stress protein YaaA, partial [Cryomorphaceae bacterium]